MKNTIGKYSLVVVILILMFSVEKVYPATNGISHKSKPGVINLEAERLPKFYEGDNRRIVNILKTFGSEKSEFETNESYAKRTGSLETMVYSFAYKPRRSAEYGGILEKELTYNAETSSFMIRLGSIKVIEKLWDDVKGSYVGQNAFGVKTRISKGSRNRYVIRLPEQDFSADLPVSPTTAKIIANDIRVLYWVTLSNVKCQKDTIIPKIDNPFDGSYNECESNTIPLEIWVYNFKTGEIFKKEKPQM